MTTPDNFNNLNLFEPKGIIFTGGPNSVYEEASPHYQKEIFDLGIPILGICYGSQLMAYSLGGVVQTAPVSEYGQFADAGLQSLILRKNPSSNLPNSHRPYKQN